MKIRVLCSNLHILLIIIYCTSALGEGGYIASDQHGSFLNGSHSFQFPVNTTETEADNAVSKNSSESSSVVINSTSASSPAIFKVEKNSTTPPPKQANVSETTPTPKTRSEIRALLVASEEKVRKSNESLAEKASFLQALRKYASNLCSLTSTRRKQATIFGNFTKIQVRYLDDDSLKAPGAEVFLATNTFQEKELFMVDFDQSLRMFCSESTQEADAECQPLCLAAIYFEHDFLIESNQLNATTSGSGFSYSPVWETTVLSLVYDTTTDTNSAYYIQFDRPVQVQIQLSITSIHPNTSPKCGKWDQSSKSWNTSACSNLKIISRNLIECVCEPQGYYRVLLTPTTSEVGPINGQKNAEGRTISFTISGSYNTIVGNEKEKLEYTLRKQLIEKMDLSGSCEMLWLNVEPDARNEKRGIRVTFFLQNCTEEQKEDYFEILRTSLKIGNLTLQDQNRRQLRIPIQDILPGAGQMDLLTAGTIIAVMVTFGLCLVGCSICKCKRGRADAVRPVKRLNRGGSSHIGIPGYDPICLPESPESNESSFPTYGTNEQGHPAVYIVSARDGRGRNNNASVSYSVSGFPNSTQY